MRHLTMILFLEQSLNGLQFGLMLFLLAAGLTLVFGIMDTINLAHGSLYMVGAYLTAAAAAASGSFLVGLAAGVVGTTAVGVALELTVLRRLYQRDHLAQVLGTFAILLMANEAVRMVWGSQPVMLSPPAALSGPVQLLPGFSYPAFRLMIIGAGLLVALALYLLVTRTRLGMQVRAGAANREMALAMGGDVPRLFTIVFGLGAALCAVAGGLLGPLLAVQVGMGESILILAFVVIVIGGIGSIRGALVGALLVGMVDTAGRTLAPMALAQVLDAQTASSVGASLAAILIYVLMAAVLFWKPTGLFPARG
jgi:branched-chain amino acid transport system permease protein